MPDHAATSPAPITPMPVAPGASLVVLIGGTFDPPHRAHLELPIRVRDELERRAGCEGNGWLVYVPVARSPHKGTGPVAPDADRLKMLELAIAGREVGGRVGVWSDEIDRAAASPGAPSYTVDTLARARAWLDAHGSNKAQLRLLIGADQALAFHKWRDPARIMALAAPVVMLRPPVASAAALLDGLRATRAWSEGELREWGNRIVDPGLMDAAATSVRALLARDAENNEKLRELLDERVLEHIRSNRLYQTGSGGSR